MSKESDELRRALIVRAASVGELVEFGEDKLIRVARSMAQFASEEHDEEELRDAIILFSGELLGAAMDYLGPNGNDIRMQGKLLLQDIGRHDLVQRYYEDK